MFTQRRSQQGLSQVVYWLLTTIPHTTIDHLRVIDGDGHIVISACRSRAFHFEHSGARQLFTSHTEQKQKHDQSP